MKRRSESSTSTVSGFAVAVLAALILALMPIEVGAQSVRPEDRNAAIRYATIARDVNDDLIAKVKSVDWTTVGFDPATAPADFSAAIEAIDTHGLHTIRELLEASALRKCDFELALEKGPVALMLPHLSDFRAAARLLKCDARRLAMRGDADGAAERLVAIVRMAKHLANDKLLISSLQAVSMCILAIDEAEGALRAGKISKVAAERLLAAMRDVDGDDAFQFRGAVRGDQQVLAEWIRVTFRGPNAGADLAATGVLLNSQDEVAEALQAAGEKDLQIAADRAATFYDDALAAWGESDAVQRLDKLACEGRGGSYGLIVQAMMRL